VGPAQLGNGLLFGVPSLLGLLLTLKLHYLLIAKQRRLFLQLSLSLLKVHVATCLGSSLTFNPVATVPSATLPLFVGLSS
jgi:hypothetical protein